LLDFEVFGRRLSQVRVIVSKRKTSVFNFRLSPDHGRANDNKDLRDRTIIGGFKSIDDTRGFIEITGELGDIEDDDISIPDLFLKGLYHRFGNEFDGIRGGDCRSCERRGIVESADESVGRFRLVVYKDVVISKLLEYRMTQNSIDIRDENTSSLRDIAYSLRSNGFLFRLHWLISNYNHPCQ
jgi:hypothetical protein